MQSFVIENSSSESQRVCVTTPTTFNWFTRRHVMKTSVQRQTYRGGIIVGIVAIAVVSTVAQAGPPPLSTNPGNLAIFPAKGQSPEQQRADETAAYDWATQQTRWDPYQAKAALDQQSMASANAANGARGGAFKGAAGGALAGVAIGAIAGDAGKGAAIGATSLGLTGGVRSRRAVKAANGVSADAATAYRDQFAVWNRNFMAAMEAKGYTVR